MTSKATTIAEYLEGLPDDRKEAISRVREEILKNLPIGFEEGMQYGMIGYYVPHSRYPAGYHCDPKQPVPYVALASQKNYMSVYLFCLYCNPKTVQDFIQAYQATGKKLDMGSSCVRFKKLEALPIELIGKAVAATSLDEFLSVYEANIPAGKRKKS